MSETLRIIPLGGLGEIGLNMLVVEYGASAVAIDCGVMFPEPSMLGIDLVVPDVSYLRDRPERLQAIVLTHGHEDHIGALPFVGRELRVPTYATGFAHALVEQKLAEHELALPLQRFKAGDTWRVGPFEIEAVHITHSIVDAVALAVTTPLGTIVHTGDFKFDQTPLDGQPSDLRRFAALGDRGVLALLSDSTNVERPGVTPSERSLGPKLEAVFRRAKGRILVSTFASHLHRIQQVFDLAALTDRKVAVVGRGMVQNVTVGQELGYLRVPPGLLVDLGELQRLPAERVALITTGSQAEPLSALTRIAMNDHKQVTVGPGDTVIFSSKMIPGNEKPIFDVINHLHRRGAEVQYETVADLHVSGHASQAELALMLNLTRPRYFVPIHGEYRHLVRHAALATEIGLAAEDCFILEDGDVLEIDSVGAHRAESITAGRVFVDGKGVGDVGDVVLRDRRHLSDGGMVVAILAVNQHTGEIISGPDLVSRGFAIEDESQAYLERAKEVVLEALAALAPESRTIPAEVKEEMRKALRRYFKKTLERRPVVLPFVMEV
ncbi:MAG: ribonuclease J [Deltaproteobacteria bacterium]|nr:MAG: ribonuclease J [Deltaproteobacteria bacterium]